MTYIYKKGTYDTLTLLLVVVLLVDTFCFLFFSKLNILVGIEPTLSLRSCFATFVDCVHCITKQSSSKWRLHILARIIFILFYTISIIGLLCLLHELTRINLNTFFVLLTSIYPYLTNIVFDWKSIKLYTFYIGTICATLTIFYAARWHFLKQKLICSIQITQIKI